MMAGFGDHPPEERSLLGWMVCVTAPLLPLAVVPYAFPDVTPDGFLTIMVGGLATCVAVGTLVWWHADPPM